MAAPPIRGFTHVSLSVGSLDASLGFYRDLLGLGTLTEPFDGTAFDGREAMLIAGRNALCLQEHRYRTGEVFDPLRSGLDHLSFSIGSIEELQEFADHLSTHGVAHSGVKPLRGFGHLIELRDPDGVLIELHCISA